MAMRKKDVGFTEKMIQYHLYNKYRDNHKYLCRNKYIFGHWESDFFRQTNTRFNVEDEIKIVRSDLVKEFNGHKKVKHDFLKETWESQGENLMANPDKPLYCPNVFNIVVPEELCDRDEIEDNIPYAGLIWVTKDGKVKVKKRTKIHKIKQDISPILLDKFYWTSHNYDYSSYILLRDFKAGKEPKQIVEEYIKNVKIKL